MVNVLGRGGFFVCRSREVAHGSLTVGLSRISNITDYRLKAAVLQNILKITSYNFFKISLQIYIIVVRNKENLHSFCHRVIPTIQNGYCVSNAVDYAKKKDVLPTNLSTSSLELKMLCLYLLGQTCLHLTFQPYLNSETYPCEYKKTAKYSYSCTYKYYRKNAFVEKCVARKFGFIYYVSTHCVETVK